MRYNPNLIDGCFAHIRKRPRTDFSYHVRKRDFLTGLGILVVEDQYLLAIETARALRKAGAQIEGLCNCEEDARAKLARRRPNAVVLDIDLGTGVSFSLAKQLCAEAIPFVFATGYPREVLPEQFKGFDRFEKPFDFSKLVQAISRIAYRQP